MKLRVLSIRFLFIFCFIVPTWERIAAAKEDSDITSGVDHLPGYVGVMLGANFTGYSTVAPTATLGATLGSRIGHFFGVALFGEYYGQSSTGPYLGLPSSTAMSVTLLAAQGNIFLESFHFGFECGAATRSWSGVASTLVGGTATSSTTLVAGLTAGYDYKLSRNLSFGIEGHYLFPGSATELNTSQIFAVVKSWL